MQNKIYTLSETGDKNLFKGLLYIAIGSGIFIYLVC